ncbi:DUF4365 domain-containing protein [Epilithonimonas pallida]|uniref:DUF4365 domain-containing protein n=1 Tax=Epilithonimonas pallida TaxID=373671 RepID=A0ABY1R687_9FLAO|nr:DUF4365 domain-containing protein [Epilithonimonas pallida]SMP97033.1 protein of unknown function [Epilithonimonas pallida]
MKKFLLQNATGNIGEHFVCLTLLSDLNFPTRIITTDLGIDGEFEIIDFETKESTSKIVKFQVKCQQKKITNKKNFKVSKEHKVYWENFIEPILFFLHTTEDKKLYFKSLTPFSFNKKNDGIYLQITKNDLYSRDNILKAIEKFKNFNYNFFEKYIDLLNRIDFAIYNGEYISYFDLLEEKNSFLKIVREFYWGYQAEIDYMEISLKEKLKKLDEDGINNALESIY